MPYPSASNRNWRLPAHVAEQLQVAQKRVYQRTVDVADARVSLASLETELGEALADLNRVINSVLGSDD
jgi:hypothetical protein